MSCQKKKNCVLIIASVASMIDQFNIPNIKLLMELGFDVDIAANFDKGNTCTDMRIRELIRQLDELCVDCYQIDFDRKAVNILTDIKAFRQLSGVLKGIEVNVNAKRHHRITPNNGYEFIHAHSPAGGLIGRIAARKYHIRTIYTAHGFHFYQGACVRNWFLFYTAEWLLSWITDVLITINKEDYQIALEKFHAKKTVYLPGIGVDVHKMQSQLSDKEKKRKELGLKNDDIMLLSVGELNKNKNHEMVMKALGKIKNADSRVSNRLHYFIAGKGSMYNKLAKIAKIEEIHLHLLGFRSDVPELLKAADIFLLPSRREGLNVGLMEAMACGVPCVVTDIRGNRDLVRNGVEGYIVGFSENEVAQAIMKIMNNEKCRTIFKKNSKAKILKFDIAVVQSKMKDIYISMKTL